MNRAPFFALTVSSAILAACSGARTFEPSDPRMKIDGYYNDGVAGRDIKLKVIGTAFGADAASFRKTLEADLQTTAMISREPTRPLLAPGPTAKPLYRLAYAFNQPYSIYGNALCQVAEEDAVPSQPGNTVNATAAFCVGGRAEAYISGATDATGPNDEQFKLLVRQMMDQVFRPDVRQEASPPPIVK